MFAIVHTLVAAVVVSLSHAQLCNPLTVQSMEFSRPEDWSGSPFPSPGDPPNLVIELSSTTLQADSFSFFFYLLNLFFN